MKHKPAASVGFLASVVLALFIVPSSAQALTSAEGTVIGDQGFYWTTPAESWIFPHRIGNIDNRVMLQYDSAASTFHNVVGIQNGPGGGFILELIDNLNLGLWVSGYTPGLGGQVRGAAAALGYSAGAGELGANDQFAAVDPTMVAGRKLDLFASYWLPELDIEAGLHLWFGSASDSYEPDDSIGPIDIDDDSQPATPVGDPRGIGAEQQLDVAASEFGLSDFGIGLGAGWRGIEDFRADLGLDINMLGVTWEPNGVDNMVDAGGSGFGINARTHYDLSDKWTIGAFVGFHTNSFSLEPLLQRDGGALVPIDQPQPADPADPLEGGQLPSPTGALPIGDPTEDPATFPDPVGVPTAGPVDGLLYESGSSQFQVALLARYSPISRVILYASLGVRASSSSTKTSVGDLWYSETATSVLSLPFIHLGFEGKVFNNMSMFVGATKQWAVATTEITNYDGRIPSNADGQGVAGTLPPAGNEHNDNARRREQITVSKRDDPVTTSTVALMLGTRLHYGPVQLVGHFNPQMLLSGTYLLSGVPSNPWLWVSLIYDWDHDSDKDFGNGTMGASKAVHKAAKPAYKKGKDKSADYEEFDS